MNKRQPPQKGQQQKWQERAGGRESSKGNGAGKISVVYDGMGTGF